LVYVHSKVSIFDDQTAIVSSANLNGRSLRWDTEAGMMLTDQKDVTALMSRCFQHWLPGHDQPHLEKTVKLWRKRAHENAQTPPEDRHGFILPYPIAPGRRFGRNLPGVPEEMT
jgi:phospholipase D1/2